MSTSFSDRLRAARQLRNLSQSELAHRADLQRSAVSLFETGKRAPCLNNLKALSEALQLNTDYLLGRVDDPSVKENVAQRIFRHVENMSQEDLDALASFAEMLANKAGKNKE